MLFAVQAQPRSSRTEIVDFSSERCKIKVKAPPVDGEANAALCAFLAKLVRIPKSRVKLVQGQRGRLKTFLLQGVAVSDLERILAAAGP